MEKDLKVNEIMEEIQAQAQEQMKSGALPAWSMSAENETRPYDWTVSSVYPAVSGDVFKRLYTKLVSKLIRCALFPVTERIGQIHGEMKDRMDQMERTIRKQELEIRELRVRAAREER